MNTKAFSLVGGGSNLILGTGRKNQTIIFNTCIIFEKKIRMEKFLLEKKFVRKILLGKNFVGKIFVRKKTCWENNFCKKKIYWKKDSSKKNYQKIFLSDSGGCDKHDLVCIFVYQMGRLCGGAHEISDIKAPLFLHGWVVWVVCW